MSILATFFRFFPRTRGEERVLHLRVPIGSSGAVGTLGGNSSFFAVTKESANGTYTVVMRQTFPALLSCQASVESGTTPGHNKTVNVHTMSVSAGTFSFCTVVTDTVANLVSGDVVNIDLHFAANTAPYA